ncbi:MAG: hypothetical protein ACSHYF_06025 [Verrucomicrobiaceae bacterium]
MNRRRHTSNLSVPALIVLLVAGIILSIGGVTYVMVKNKQVSLRGQITKVQKRMVEHNVAITMHKSDIEQELGVFQLREKLTLNKSQLQSIPKGVVEVLNPTEPDPPASDAVAKR